jgi:hypothetical protein
VSFQSGTKAVGVLVVLGAALSACSEIYYDRRETVSLGAGDAVAINAATQTVDPWPRHSANRNIAFNGERMQAAAERYRLNKVTVPVSATTSTAAYSAQQAAAAAAAHQASTTAPAAPVKGP